MKWLLIALVVIAALLGAYIALVDSKGLSSRDAEGRTGLLVERFSEPHANRIVLDHDNVHIVLERPSNATMSDELAAPADNWEMREPLKVHADGNEIQKVLNLIVNAFPERWIADASDQDLATFGFKNPAAKLGLRVANQTIDIELGAPAPYPSTYYARVVGESRIAVITADVRDAFFASALDLRDKVLLLDAMDHWSSWRWTLGSSVVAMHKAGDVWKFDDTTMLTPNHDRVEDLGWALRSLKATKFVAQEPTLQSALESFELGFDNGAPIRIDILGQCPDAIYPDNLLASVTNFGTLCIEKIALGPLRRSSADLSQAEPAQP